ncbi:alcohol dehydrogenase 2 [Corynespora cassiicola Philippines]|uniref:Alcohol dehydrogenase 2 n=1 Tax=Corynespora cassiicola Philippines TaxID=1448308 RepID=A0A2T2N7Y3_CORCC|nr:alcohol dehydrogenase 2 [Corynespora cassiicola Philippines]
MSDFVKKVYRLHNGVFHSDLGVMTNLWIVKMGPGTENSAVKIGDWIGVKWMSSICDACEPCHTGMDGNCLNGKISGYYTPGTFQQYVIGPANYVTPIPDVINSAAAAPLLYAGVTAYAALRKSNAVAGDFVVILGAGGGLGHLAVQYSERGIGHRVIGIDHSSKKELILNSGAERFISVDATESLSEAVKALTDGLGAHAVIVCIAHQGAYDKALDLLRFGGRVVCVGIPEGDMRPIASATAASITIKELQVVGCTVGTRKEAVEAIGFAARGIMKTHLRIEKLEKLTVVFNEMNTGTLKGRVVIDLSD